MTGRATVRPSITFGPSVPLSVAVIGAVGVSTASY